MLLSVAKEGGLENGKIGVLYRVNDAVLARNCLQEAIL